MSNKPRMRYDASVKKYYAVEPEQRAGSISYAQLSDSESWLADWLAPNTVSGQRVNESIAASFSTVYACVKVIAETMAQLPLEIHERNGRSTREARDHYLWPLLHDAPNSEMSSYTWRLNRWMHKALWGNSYDFLSFDRAGRVQQIIPLLPDRTWAERRQGRLIYITRLDDGERIELDSFEVAHDKDMCINNDVNGSSPIRINREAVASGIATRDFGSKIYTAGFLNGVIEHPGHFSNDDAYNTFSKRWHKTYSGNSNAGKTAVLERGMKFQSIGMPARDAQFIEARKYNRAEIAAIFRVPLSMIQDLEYSGVRANIEQQDTNFAKHTVGPQAVCAEQEFHRKLLITDAEKANNVIRFDLDGLMRGDSQARAEYYSKGITAGWLKRSTAAEKEGLPLTTEDYEALDSYLVPVNMANAAMMSDEATDTIEPIDDENERSSLPASLLRSIQATRDKLLEREAKALERIARTADSAQDFADKAGKLLDQQEKYIVRNVGPLLDIANEISNVPHGTVNEVSSKYRAEFLALRDFTPEGVAAFSNAREFSLIE